MTNYNERLDKILMGVWHEGYNRCNQEKNHPDGYDNYSYSMNENQAKQALLNWHNKRVEEVLDMLHSKPPKNNWLQGSELFYGFDEGVKDYQSAIQSERKKLGSE